jgi:hypothetical protein
MSRGAAQLNPTSRTREGHSERAPGGFAGGFYPERKRRGMARMNGGQPDEQEQFIDMNARTHEASERVQWARRMLGDDRQTGRLTLQRDFPEGQTMLTKLAAAVFAASMILAPAFAAQTPTPRTSANPEIRSNVSVKQGKISHLRHRHAHQVRHQHRVKNVAGSKQLKHPKQTVQTNG